MNLYLFHNNFGVGRQYEAIVSAASQELAEDFLFKNNDINWEFVCELPTLLENKTKLIYERQVV